MTFEKLIERNIERRTCTRLEWHALRRHRWRRTKGIAYDVWLAPAVIGADFHRAAKAWLRSPQGRAVQRLAAMASQP